MNSELQIKLLQFEKEKKYVMENCKSIGEIEKKLDEIELKKKNFIKKYQHKR